MDPDLKRIAILQEIRNIQAYRGKHPLLAEKKCFIQENIEAIINSFGYEVQPFTFRFFRPGEFTPVGKEPVLHPVVVPKMASPVIILISFCPGKIKLDRTGYNGGDPFAWFFFQAS